MTRVRWLGVLCTLHVIPLAAQDHAHHGTAPERLGRVVFPVSCDAEAQQRFERAMALTHSFWWDAADRAFQGVAEADPACAMAHWGRALSLRGNPFAGPPSAAALREGLAAIEQAESLAPPTPRERGYVEALALLFRDHERLDHRTRSTRYEEAMRALSQRHPDDPEAAILHARELVANTPTTDKSFERQTRAGEILEGLLASRPDHPGLAHYLIHAYDAPPIAHRGVDAAVQYSRIAPSVPHAQHMPSHIFTRLGMWEESIEANTASAEAARRYEEERGMSSASMDRVHAWDYLVYAHLQRGQDAEARRILEEAAAVEAVPVLAADYALAAIPARHALERGRWAEAARLPVRPAMASRVGEAITHYARGIGMVRGGQAAAARAEVEALAGIREALRERGEGEWADRVEAHRLAVAAWTARAAGDEAEALRLAAAAADLEEEVDKHPVTPGPILPARELQGDLLLEMGRAAEALRAYETALRFEPNRARTLFGAARAAERAGDAPAATRHYAQLARVMAEGADREELRAARAYLARR